MTSGGNGAALPLLDIAAFRAGDRCGAAETFVTAPRLEPVTLPAELAADAPASVPNDPGNPIFAEYGVNALKGWLRSHPEVARRHWSDLVPPT